MNLLTLTNDPALDEQLMTVAQEHHDAGRYREAIVFAHIAGELITEQVLTQLVMRVEPEALRPWLFSQVDRGHNLATMHVRKLYEALSGNKLGETNFWTDFDTHNQLRNDIMHRGIEVTAEQAAASIRAVGEMKAELSSNLPS